MNNYNNNNINNTNMQQQSIQIDERQVASYMTKVMGWMSAGLAITFAIAYLFSSTTLINIFANSIVFYGVLIAELAVVVIFSAAINKINSMTALLMFILYSSLTGATLSIIMIAYELTSILYVLGLTIVIFLVMAAYGYITQKDLTKIGTMAVFGLIGIIIASVFNLFMKSDGVSYIVSIIGVLIFIVLTAWDTQRIKNQYLYETSQGTDEKSDRIQKFAIYGALMLYLDFINMFLKLLRLFGRRR